jgi:thioredoxin-dependent peroxiredoxin
MKRICLISVFILASFCMYSQKNLSIGDKIPLFKATADDGSTWDISKYIGKDYIIVYFSPAAKTSGCTKLAGSYRDHQGDLTSANAIVVGISGDTPENLKLWLRGTEKRARVIPPVLHSNLFLPLSFSPFLPILLVALSDFL